MSHLLIQPEVLREQLTRPNCLVFDVRHDLTDMAAGRQAYEAGHIPGAVYLDHETQLCAPCTGRNGRHPLPDQAAFEKLMHEKGLTSNSEVVVYDGGTSMFAAHLWWMLRWIGHDAVAVLDGGWAAWTAADGAIESLKQNVPADKENGAQAQVSSSKPAMPTVDADGVVSNLKAPHFTVLDARAPERFRGDVEPLDPVAGHIPGAKNRPFSENLLADGRFKPAAQLRKEFEALLNNCSPENIVHQCGSGISACHNLFAMEVAGLCGSALYPGSWSEWCSDPSRPTAQGA
ncbi:sulfurtransferase [Alcaligenaceae bacterium]|nr:sulfurtransferase [Alcaligenaceae bacterium]